MQQIWMIARSDWSRASGRIATGHIGPYWLLGVTSRTAEHCMFLTAPDLEQLTGRKRYKAQAQWLARHGYRFEMNALGRPVVLMSAIQKKLNPSASSSRQPNFDAMNDG